MRRLLALLVLLGAAPAAADTGCALLVRHVPAADVAYRPGVDVHGRPVAPADLDPQPRIPAGQRVWIDLALPLAQFRRGRPRRIDEADVLLGAVEIDLATGAVWLDGQRLDQADSDALAALCRAAEGLPPLPAHKPAPKSVSE